VHIVSLVLIMLLLVVFSGFLVRMLPKRLPIPLPLIQIALGALIATTTGLHVALDPHIFFLLFIPPLLFLDGWRIPKQGLFRDKGTILELALGLVLFTVVGMGLFIHWMIPTMPIAVAFALAAVVSPTDPVAVSAIAARVPIPKRMMHILEGESLLNDASGLVCLRFAVAAAMTGVFSLPEAVLTFLWLAIGGVAIGVALTWGVTRLKGWIAMRFGEESGTQILLSLLIPFGAYMLAEHFHCSGILAAVAAGVTMSYAEASGQTLAVTRVRRNAVWDTVQFAANGIIFILLGEQFPYILEGAVQTVRESGHHEAWWLIVYVLAITLGLGLMRFLWVSVSLHFNRILARRRGEIGPKPSWRLIAAMSAAGVRGAITLAGVLTLPLVMTDGSAFPARDLAIFLASGVIITSLIIASVGLPILLHGIKLPPEPSREAEEDIVRAAAARAAIRAIEQEQHNLAEGRSDADLYAATATQIMDIYSKRLNDTGTQTGEEKELIRKVDEIERKLRLAGLRAERDEIFRQARTRQIGDDLMRKLVREIDLMDARYT
jgi:CPA1 family monovalent cation:H+ antiporter